MKIETIMNCPSCGIGLERVKAQLFCRNPDCGKKNYKIVEHYAKVLKIKGLGEKTIEKLNFNSILDIYSISPEKLIEELGITIGKKLYKEIINSKTLRFDKFIEALGIPLVGPATARKLSKHFNNIDELTYEACRGIELGDVTSRNIDEWLDANWIELSELPITFLEGVVGEGQTVCSSGKIKGMTRDNLEQYVTDAGYTFTNNMSGKVDILICDDQSSNSSKINKAKN